MSGYVLYFPKLKGADPEHLDRAGLSVLRDGSIETTDLLQGPDGGIGLLMFWSDPHKPTDLNVDRYNWTPSVPQGELPAGRFYLGLPADGIKPRDIERKVVQPGYAPKLADNQPWTIPAAKMLPHKHGLGPDGEHVRMIVDRYKDYWDKSQQYAAQFCDAIDELLSPEQQIAIRAGAKPEDIKKQFTLADTWDFCVTALSINYRLNGDLVSALGLLDDTAMSNVCKAAIDLPQLIDVESQKKTESVTIPVGLSI